MNRTAMMTIAMCLAIFAIGAIVVVGYFVAQASVVMLEMVTKMTEELR